MYVRCAARTTREPRLLTLPKTRQLVFKILAVVSAYFPRVLCCQIYFRKIDINRFDVLLLLGETPLDGLSVCSPSFLKGVFQQLRKKCNKRGLGFWDLESEKIVWELKLLL